MKLKEKHKFGAMNHSPQIFPLSHAQAFPNKKPQAKSVNHNISSNICLKKNHFSIREEFFFILKSINIKRLPKLSLFLLLEEQGRRGNFLHSFPSFKSMRRGFCIRLSIESISKLIQEKFNHSNTICKNHQTSYLFQAMFLKRVEQRAYGEVSRMILHLLQLHSLR